MVNIHSAVENNCYLIKIEGEVDASSSIHLDNAIAKARDEGFNNVLIDCTDLFYISSAGLGVFMSYIEDFQKREKKLVIFGLNEKVRNVFQILGLDQLLTIAENKEMAKELLDEV